MAPPARSDEEPDRTSFDGVLRQIGRLPTEGTRAVLLAVVIVALVVVAAFRGNVLALVLLVVVVLAALWCVLYLHHLKMLRAMDRKQRTDPVHLGPEQQENVRRALTKIATVAAATLDVPDELVRTNVFSYRDGCLRIVEELTHNMRHAPEMELLIRPGEGSCGTAFDSGDATIAVLEEDWGEHDLPTSELRKVHPDLRWVVSIPILGADSNPVGVLNVDGLRHPHDSQALTQVLPRIVPYAKVVELAMAGTDVER